MFDLTMHSTHFIYGYIALNLYYGKGPQRYQGRKSSAATTRSTPISTKVDVVLNASSHRQDSTYPSHYYTSRGTRYELNGSNMSDRSINPLRNEQMLCCGATPRSQNNISDAINKNVLRVSLNN